MEFASRIRWIIVIAIFLVVLLFIGWGLFSIASNLFNRSDDNTEQVQTNNDFSVQSTAVATYTVEGPVVANEDQRSYTIEVSENVVSMKVYKSYGQELIKQTSHKNTALAYDAFLSALDNAKVNAITKNASEDYEFKDQGVCARGRKFFVRLDGSVLRWSTSCSSKEGNAGFLMGAVSRLFHEQVPDYSEMIRGVGI